LAVPGFFGATDRGVPDFTGQGGSDVFSTGPGIAAQGAGLCFFRGVDPEEANVLGADLQRIAIDDIGPALE
jgi:hypothetical protein